MSTLVPIVTATLGAAPELAAQIIGGLNSGVFERVGGVIRKTGSKETVAWLRTVSDESPAGHAVSSVLGPLVQLNAAVAVLNLSITAVGFALVMKRLGAVEQRLASISKALEGIGRKIDLGFYANFRAAIELARSAFAMTAENNRRVAATQAINRLLEAEQHYLGLIDIELGNGSWAVSPLISTYILAGVSASRCYLELGELETARHKLANSAGALESRVKQYSDGIVGVNPAVFLHPKLAGEITLERMTTLQRRERPGITETQVFEALRQPLWETANRHPDSWIKKLPAALWNDDIDGQTKLGPIKRRRSSEEMFERLLPRLPEAFSEVEQAHEALGCIRGFETEIQFLLNNKISYSDWQRLEMPTMSAPDSIVCLIPRTSELMIRPVASQ